MISRIVLFTHPRAAYGTFERPTIDLITTATADVVALAEVKPDALSPRQQQILDKLIRQDHRFHEQRIRRHRAEAATTTCQVAHW